MFKKLAPLCIAVAAVPAQAATPAPEQAVRAILAPYAIRSREPATSWERPVFTRPIAALIAHWQRVTPKDEPDDLSDGDWFCQCQDWDAKTFRITAVSTASQGPARAEVRVTFRIGWGEMRQSRFVMQLEGGRWLIQDMFNEFNQRGLQFSLRQTIAADEAQRKQAKPK